jgi:hypothetical protein
MPRRPLEMRALRYTYPRTAAEAGHVPRRSRCRVFALSFSNQHPRAPGWCALASRRLGATGAGKPIIAAGHIVRVPDGPTPVCAANTAAGVALFRSSGESSCMMGKTWGYDDAGVWVFDGCGGEFTGSITEPSGGSDFGGTFEPRWRRRIARAGARAVRCRSDRRCARRRTETGLSRTRLPTARGARRPVAMSGRGATDA